MKQNVAGWHRRMVLVPACVLAVALAGCAADDSDDSSATQTSGGSAASAAPSTSATPVELTGLDEGRPA